MVDDEVLSTRRVVNTDTMQTKQNEADVRKVLFFLAQNQSHE